MRRLLAALVLALLALGARAQEAALVADRLFIDAEGRLIAEGNVQAFHRGAVLSAAAIAYDPTTDRLTVTGPILIREPSGAILAAESAEIDPRLEDGLLRGARLVLDRQLQLAASRIDRVGGLTALTGAAATSCQVCPGRAPLWEITAAQVVHDEAQGFLHFEDAVFRIRGLPILWLPRLRLPEPGNDRASGLLVPSVRSSDRLGLGLRLPFFVTLGRSRDLTLTPYLSPATRTLEARYRQAFLSGDLTVRGALTRDDLLPGEKRGYVQAEGRFEPGRGVVLTFDLTAVSDDSYLADYGLSEEGRLLSTARLERATAATLLLGDLGVIRPLGEGEDPLSFPLALGGLSWEARRPAWGGRFAFGVGADFHRRPDTDQGDLSRDAARLGAFADWRGGRIVGPGLLIEGQGRLSLDAWRIGDDPAHPDRLARAAPALAATLRFPLVRHGGGASDLIEPVLSLGWTGAFGDEPPDEDSRLAELDGGNLFALDRLPGEDRLETGGRLSFGLAWTRESGSFVGTFALGRILRTEPVPASVASGLSGVASDVLAEARLDLAGAFSFEARALLDGWSIGKSEARLDWSGEAATLSAAFVRLPADPAEGRERTAAEWSLDAEWRPSDRWTLRAGARYDLVAETPSRASLGIGWRNECVEVDLSATRRYTTSDGSEPSTDFGLSVNLLGFQAGERRARPGACRD